MTVAKFNIGDKVAMPGIPVPVVVEAFGTCEDGTECPFGDEETFAFQDPGGLGTDWMHTSQFEKIGG